MVSFARRLWLLIVLITRGVLGGIKLGGVVIALRHFKILVDLILSLYRIP